jgi:fatty acid desaturase
MNVERFDPSKIFTPEEMAEVRARSDLTGMLCVLHAWVVIGAMMALFAIWPNPLTFIIAVVVIGGRQLGLAILMHDAAHGVLMRTRWLNEFAGGWLCGYPVLGDLVSYRHYHLVHHRRTQQSDDPDIGLSAPFPITRASFRRKMIRDITGQTGFKQRKSQFLRSLGEKGQPLGERARTYWKRLGPQTVTNLVLFALITRIRNIAEHAVVTDNNDVFRNARTTYASWWERMIVAPYWVNYHVDHHLLFYVPCYNLPKLHALLLKKGLGAKMEIQPNYLAILKLATSKPEAGVPVAA